MEQNPQQPQAATPTSDRIKQFGDGVSQVIKEQAGIINQSASKAVNDVRNQFSSPNNSNSNAFNNVNSNFAAAPSPLAGGLINSEFKMSALELLFYGAVTQIGAVFTLGLALPWLICWQFRAIASATYIDGRQLQFVGRGGDLFVKWIKWMIFTIFTLGIYGIWASRNMMAWIVEHTHQA